MVLRSMSSQLAFPTPFCGKDTQMFAKVPLLISGFDTVIHSSHHALSFIISLPFFTDNFFGNQQPIKEQGKMYTPAKPDAAFTPIAVQDVGLAAANILTNPEKHQNKTYNVCLHM
eukprot:TRINITY_DN9993_c0_g1_i1.p3 TRINITY_DN9993_c0_g1~~TRINITY_DN9993_c0_g1_i1.p3  ORF type:complete len:115 (+),score=20.03 TRINITY_DN9993_c0_g1_i1:1221-1565(+)